jgi:hypothetical protein
MTQRWLKDWPWEIMGVVRCPHRATERGKHEIANVRRLV